MTAGLWLVVALFSDGWAHANVPDLEGFFTPWHAALYAGLAVNAAWLGWLGWPHRAGGWRRALPAGYGWGAVGAAVFAAGGVADMAWHLTLGVEVGIDALLSPSHLVLFAGGMLMVTSAVRSRWGAGDTSSVVAQVALASATALAAFFLLYVSEFAAAAPTVPYRRLPEGAPGHLEGELPALAGLGGFLVTTAVVVVPLLLAWQRGRAPRGLVTVLVAIVAGLSAVVVNPGPAALIGAAGATVGAVAADALVQRLDRRPWAAGPLRLTALAAAVAALVWAGHVAALGFMGLEWPPELWAGVVVLCTMAAATLGCVATGVGSRNGDDVVREPRPTTSPAPPHSVARPTQP